MLHSKIVLASSSPRRRELLAGLGVEFEAVPAEVEELDAVSAPKLAPVYLARKNARLKAQTVARTHPDRWILAADTIVVLESRIFGKPSSLDEARIFLRTLSGQKHEVITACALVEPDGKSHEFQEVSGVTFRALTPEIIDQYLEAVDVLDKAGGYALQEQGDLIIEQVEGSHSNVIGLPVEKIETVFKKRGLL